MAGNAFDKFDAPANAFDRFDAPLSQARRDQQAKGDMDGAYGRIQDLAGGIVRGAGNIGATLLSPVDYLARKVGIENSVIGRTDRREAMDALFNDRGFDTGSLPFKGGKIGAEVAGTLGAGGMAANAVRGAAPILTRLGASAPAINTVASSIASGGFKAGEPAANLFSMPAVLNGATRIGGGAAAGGIQAGMINPEETGLGMGLGGALPPLLKGAGALGSLPGKGLNMLRQPGSAGMVRNILDAAEASTPEQIQQFRAGLNQAGPSMVPGSVPTVPQIAQLPGISQLQRTAKNAGNTSIGNREVQNNTAQIASLNNIAPVSGTVHQAAQDFGNVTQNFARSAEKNASRDVTRLYDSVDPMDVSRLFLPISDMKAAQAKFLGSGTFGTGTRAQQAIDTATKFGQTSYAAEKPVTTQGLQDLVMAVRAAGGINTSSKSGIDLAGEIRNLRESGLNNIVKPNTGKSVERLAEQMHEAGYLPDNDPATLLDHLHMSANGDKVYQQGTDEAFAMMQQHAQGLSPAYTAENPVSFNTVNNLRSSINESAQQAGEKGSLKEAGALNSMIGSIDSRINRAAGGAVQDGEHFPSDMADRYRAALSAHGEKMDRFHTGPQVSMFRNGADGNASAMGAELAPKFFNAGGSQTDDAIALQRLAGGNQQILDGIKRYAVTDLVGQTNKFGMLSNGKYNNWLDARSGAVQNTFNPSEASLMGQVGGQVKAADLAENLGRASGSNTVQNASNALNLGMLDHPAVNAMANRVPFVKAFTGPILDTMKLSARASKANQLGGLLSNPDELDQAIGQYMDWRGKSSDLIGGRLGGLLNFVGENSYRVGPPLLSDQ